MGNEDVMEIVKASVDCQPIGREWGLLEGKEEKQISGSGVTPASRTW